jgi:CheY-like chemotaxis protein
MLDNLHVTANIVDDGFAAVEAAKRQDYDLVLLDVQMPGKDGMQTAREIRALRGTSTYIAAMTASVMAADRAACLNAGMDDFIPKPVRVEDLERRLLTVMARGKGDTRN